VLSEFASSIGDARAPRDAAKTCRPPLDKIEVDKRW
jgi:hypothetical protein